MLLVAAGCTVAARRWRAAGGPHLAVLGLLLGLVLMRGLAAVTAAFTRTVESAQVTTLPLLFVSLLGSGHLRPAGGAARTGLASVCELLPLTGGDDPAYAAGWTGGLAADDAARAPR